MDPVSWLVSAQHAVKDMVGASDVADAAVLSTVGEMTRYDLSEKKLTPGRDLAADPVSVVAVFTAVEEIAKHIHRERRPLAYAFSHGFTVGCQEHISELIGFPPGYLRLCPHFCSVIHQAGAFQFVYSFLGDKNGAACARKITRTGMKLVQEARAGPVSELAVRSLEAIAEALLWSDTGLGNVQRLFRTGNPEEYEFLRDKASVKSITGKTAYLHQLLAKYLGRK